jgi:ribosome-binding protein aMBF1 (putative translation factor)
VDVRLEVGAVMTFGESLKEARVNRGWSRSRLIIAIRARIQDRTLTISQETIRDLEEGQAKNPRDTTKAVLIRVLPELLTP